LGGRIQNKPAAALDPTPQHRQCCDHLHKRDLCDPRHRGSHPRASSSAFSRFLWWFRKPPEASTWFLPNGRVTEQCGERRTDLLLVWAADDGGLLDDDRIRAQWPGCQEVRPLARNLFLVLGVCTPSSDHIAKSVPAEVTPCALATRLLAEAKQKGDVACHASPPGQARRLAMSRRSKWRDMSWHAHRTPREPVATFAVGHLTI